MPTNENYYLIKSKFADFLKDFPEFIIIHNECDDYVNVAIHSADFFKVNSLVSHHTSQYLVKQLFQQLEKDYIEDNELIDLGRLFKNYLLLLKQIRNDQAYFKITPGVMVGLFIALHTCLLFFPSNKALVYSSLIADLYSLGFWLFSVGLLNKNEQALHRLETQLMEKINFLKSLSILPQAEGFYLRSSLSSSVSILPSYQDVLLEDAMRCMEEASIPTLTRSATTSNFFGFSRFYNACCDTNENEADPRLERCYSI